jgi:small subunit ribosomal protein S6
MVVIITPEVADDDVEDAVDRLIRRPIEGEGGTLDEVDSWGRRKLAYPIQKHVEGNYVLTHLQIDPENTTGLERGLQISEEVLRYLLIRLDE